MNERGARLKTQAEWFGEQAYEAWQTAQSSLAAGRLDDARRWLERARRLAPRDVTAKLSLAVVLLGLADPAATAMFEEICAGHDLREAWLGLAAAHAEAHRWTQAAAALASALARHAFPASADIGDLALRIVQATGAPGWCCLRADGGIDHALADPRRGGPVVFLDGVRLAARPRSAPRTGNRLALMQDGRDLLGSPLSLALIRRVEGFVEERGGGLAGWAWQPGNPDADPPLLVRAERGGPVLRIVAADTGMIAGSPMARPRRFEVPAASLAGRQGLVHVTGPDGHDLPGSPLDPGALAACATIVARAVAAALPAIKRKITASRPRLDPLGMAVSADLVGPRPRARPDPKRRLAIVVPVYRDHQMTLACLQAARETMPEGTRLIVVDDATPEPQLAASLDQLAASRSITLLRHTANRGFPAAANTGLRVAAALPGRPDVVLLNSDALLTRGALAALRTLVQGTPDIGTATPFSNDATILSYPDPAGDNPVPDRAALARVGRLAARANAGVAVDIPTAVGFCMYIRRECLDDAGLFREDVFAQGYGEENDFCIRARHLGWRHVAAPGVFVGHAGGRSFGAARHALIARNLAVLERLHPGYHALIAGHQAADPLAPARRKLDLARWSEARGTGKRAAAILITHDSGGGVERALRARCAALRGQGFRPIVLRSVPDPDAPSDDARQYRPGLCAVGDGGETAFPNLRFDLPRELALLVRLLRAERPAFVEIHHLLGHDPALPGLAERLGVPWDVHVHDYIWFCPRITLLGENRRYCGEPTDPATCEACVADLGRHDEQDIPVAALRLRSAGVLGAARRVVAPSADVAARLRRHFPAIRAEVCWLEDDSDLPPLAAPARRAMKRVCVVGGIGPGKGFDVLLACARDAAARDLKLEFVVVGHTIDDPRLLATGRVFVTGPYQEGEAEREIRAQEADLAFLPSIWPETWCYTLGDAWRAGLRVAAFDIGAQAERMRRTGRGWLLPLGLPAAAINNALLAATDNALLAGTNNALLAATAFAGDECGVIGRT